MTVNERVPEDLLRDAVHLKIRNQAAVECASEKRRNRDGQL